MRTLQQEGTLVCVKGGETKKRRQRPKVTWIVLVWKGYGEAGITSEVAINRNTWCMRILEADSKQLGKGLEFMNTWCIV